MWDDSEPRALTVRYSASQSKHKFLALRETLAVALLGWQHAGH
jgi:hypothetical protein